MKLSHRKNTMYITEKKNKFALVTLQHVFYILI